MKVSLEELYKTLENFEDLDWESKISITNLEIPKVELEFAQKTNKTLNYSIIIKGDWSTIKEKLPVILIKIRENKINELLADN